MQGCCTISRGCDGASWEHLPIAKGGHDVARGAFQIVGRDHYWARYTFHLLVCSSHDVTRDTYLLVGGGYEMACNTCLLDRDSYLLVRGSQKQVGAVDLVGVVLRMPTGWSTISTGTYYFTDIFGSDKFKANSLILKKLLPTWVSWIVPPACWCSCRWSGRHRPGRASRGSGTLHKQQTALHRGQQEVMSVM
jgi:hypothetical protein